MRQAAEQTFEGRAGSTPNVCSVKALSIRQPWAWAIIHAGRDVENRSWWTAYGGDLLVHASKGVDGEGWRWIRRHTGIIVPPIDELERGALIGVVRVADVLDNRATRSRWRMSDRFCWVFDKPRALLRPIPFVGALGLFEVTTLRAAHVTGH